MPAGTNHTPATGNNKAKKTLAILAIIFGIILLLLSGTTLLLRHDKVQTYIVGIVAEKLSVSLNADVHIKHIYYRPLNHLTIDSLYISDQQRDTLAFIEQANIAINLLQLRNQRVDMTLVELHKPYINLQSPHH